MGLVLVWTMLVLVWGTAPEKKGNGIWKNYVAWKKSFAKRT